MKLLSGLLALASTITFAAAIGGAAATAQVPHEGSRLRPAPPVAVLTPSVVGAIASVNLILGTGHSIFRNGFE